VDGELAGGPAGGAPGNAPDVLKRLVVEGDAREEQVVQGCSKI